MKDFFSLQKVEMPEVLYEAVVVNVLFMQSDGGPTLMEEFSGSRPFYPVRPVVW